MGKIVRSWSALYESRKKIRNRYPDFWRLRVRKKHTEVILEELKDGDGVLDVGAWNRALQAFLEKHFQNIHYRSMDIDREKFHDYYSLDEIDEFFDAVFLFEVIEHLEFEQGVKMLTRVREMLRPGGKMLLTTPNLFHPNRYWECSHRVCYRYDEICGILEALGYRIKDIYRIYNDAFLKRLFRLCVASPLHQYLSVDFARSILVVALKK